MGLVLSTKNLILKELLPMATHEGLKTVYNARRELYYDKERGEMLRKIVKKNCKFKRLNKLLDLGAKL